MKPHRSSTAPKVIRRQVRDYLAAQTPTVRKLLRGFDATIREVAPEVEPVFSYGFPGFKLGGKATAHSALAARSAAGRARPPSPSRGA